MKLNFLETLIAVCSGAIIAATVTYYISRGIIHRLHVLKVKKHKLHPEKKAKRKFKFSNRLIIRIKWKFGKYGVCFLAPLILSIPIGTAVTTKFYHKNKDTLPLIIAGIIINGMILTSIAYIKHLLKL